ncbi:MAG: GGDEF domain-containing protein, partial [Vitreoscilla sp.]|nr:GGDEF domain-containing protein [Polaromonas sp.]
MDKFAIGLWGCFFGVVAVILTGSAFAYARSLHRIALNAAMSAVASALYVVAFLSGLPVADVPTQAVFLAVVTLAVSALLTYLLFAILGFLKSVLARQRAAIALCGVVLVVLLLGWLPPAPILLITSTAVACLLGLVALGAAV